MSTPKRRARRKRRHTVLRAVLGTAFTLALVTALSVTFLYRQLESNLGEFANEEEQFDYERPEQVADGEPLDILLVGSDKEDEGGRRSDTTILMHVSADRDFAYGISLPRDALVDRPDCVDDNSETVPGEEMVMFNTAYSAGGAICTVKTLETLTDVPIDAVVEMDFEGFERMVDAIDGVEICVPNEIEDEQYNISLPEGTYNATGEQALDYVRERHQGSPNGDLGRIKRQQAFLASMVNKVVSADTLTNPNRVSGFLQAVTGSMTISSEYRSLAKLGNLGLQLNGIGLDQITFITVPNEEYAPDPNRLVWTEEADDLWELVRTDQPLTGEFLGEAITATDSTGTIAPGGSGTAAPSTTAPPSSSATSEPTDTDSATSEPTDSDPAEALTPEEIAEQNGLCA
ncbi:LCP family protein [Nocardioides sp. ChNu-153]|uniref:LCP family protein n=1 Tax=Nocardioides sp. ChNu-153 TaxID=2779364 RepID=UPI00264DF56E|nr:LCP family protein [Nocardioides sp. ChNu-153]MDN7122821.1 LCP family protein [Nocardioides sp. ChNu-153]